MLLLRKRRRKRNHNDHDKFATSANIVCLHREPMKNPIASYGNPLGFDSEMPGNWR